MRLKNRGSAPECIFRPYSWMKSQGHGKQALGCIRLGSPGKGLETQSVSWKHRLIQGGELIPGAWISLTLSTLWVEGLVCLVRLSLWSYENVRDDTRVLSKMTESLVVPLIPGGHREVQLASLVCGFYTFGFNQGQTKNTWKKRYPYWTCTDFFLVLIP